MEWTWICHKIKASRLIRDSKRASGYSGQFSWCLKDQQHVLLAFVGYSSRSLFFFLDLHVHSYLDEGDIKTHDVPALSTSSCPTFGYLSGRLHSHLPDSLEPRISVSTCYLPCVGRAFFVEIFQDKTLKSKSPKPSKTQETSNPKNLNPRNLKS